MYAHNRIKVLSFFILLLISMLLLGLSTITTDTLGAPLDFKQLRNDSGTRGGAFDGLRGTTTVAARLAFDPADRPVRIDSVEIYLEPPPGGPANVPFFVSIHRSINNVPGPYLVTVRERLTVSVAGWYSIRIPDGYEYEDSASSFVVAVLNEDFPSNTPPSIGLDDSTNIPRTFNYYGANFASWQEHYTYWTDAENVGNLMIRASIATGSDALTPISTATATPTATATSPPPTNTPTPTPSPTPTLTPTPTRVPGAIIVELGPSADTYVDDGRPNENFGSLDSLRVGEQASSRQYRVLLGEFPLSGLPQGAHIIRAELGVRANASANLSTLTLQAQTLTGAWTEMDATFNNTWTLWGDIQDSRTVTGYVSTGQLFTFDVTDLVRAWQDDTQTDHGIGISGSSAAATGVLAFWSHDAPFAGPLLRITYTGTRPPGTPTYLPIIVR